MAKAKRKVETLQPGIIPPTKERMARGEVERGDRQMQDSRGDPGDPFRAVDLLTGLERKGAISADMLKAGEQFRDDFSRAALEPLRAADLNRVGGSGSGPSITGGQIAARRRVWEAVTQLGGAASPAGSCAWHVIGLGCTLREWALRLGWGGGRAVSPHAAAGVLLGTLGTLVAHYGLDEPVAHNLR